VTTVYETGPEPRVLFCAVDDCAAAFADLVVTSTSLDCAFFRLTDPAILAALRSRKSRVFLDDGQTQKVSGLHLRDDQHPALMHNKFCIVNETTVWMGSYNPTVAGKFDRNDVLVLQSPLVAHWYQDEFDELWAGQSHGGLVRRSGQLMRNNGSVDVRFCPEDNCQALVLSAMQDAKNAILFMTYSFTDSVLGDQLMAARARGVEVRGIADPTFRSRGVYPSLTAAGIPVLFDPRPGLLHHKLFIIDGAVVITGSYNPTRNGAERNDENVLMYTSAGVAQQYREYFEEQWKTLTALPT